MPSVLKKLVSRLRSRAGGVTLALPLCALASWIFTGWLYAHWTESGEVYERALTPSLEPVEAPVVVIRPNQDYFARFFDEASRVTEIDVFMAGRIALTLSIGPTDGLAAGPRATCVEGGASYSLSWRMSGSASHGAQRLFGDDSVAGCVLLVGFSAAPWWAEHARDVDIQVPRGGLEPLITMLLQQAGKGNGDLPAAETLNLVSKRLAAEVATRLGYDELEQALGPISFRYGPVQFLTVTMMVFCLLALVLSLFCKWARDVAENAMSLIPYIGFFGTLLGMGAALAILGQANLSDPVSKAINLGPIGSKLALAIETTKLALVCFGLTTLAAIVRDAFRKN